MALKRDYSMLDQSVRERIFSGQLKPGEQIVEAKLAAELGVSRSPVRESLSRLVGQGVLQSGGKWQGIRLREYSIDDIIELYEYRQAIESQAAYLAAGNASVPDIERLAVIFDHLDQMAAGDGYGSTQWSVTDERFHRAIVSMSKNARLLAAYDSIIMERRFAFYQNPVRVKYQSQANERLHLHSKEVRGQHRRIYDAIRARQPEEAREATRDALAKAVHIMTYLFALEEMTQGDQSVSVVKSSSGS